LLGIGDDATMEGNTQQKIATDLKTILPEHPPRKVSVTGCHSDKCGNNGNSFSFFHHSAIFRHFITLNHSTLTIHTNISFMALDFSRYTLGL
jgi:hypothetical protein